jgi:hypothetical protein
LNTKITAKKFLANLNPFLVALKSHKPSFYKLVIDTFKALSMCKFWAKLFHKIDSCKTEFPFNEPSDLKSILIFSGAMFRKIRN